MRRLLALLMAAVFVVGAAGCGSPPAVDAGAAAAVGIDRAPLDAAGTHRIVAIGEATHGNHEMAEIRRTLLLRLAAEQGFRTVALEADFGGAEVVNDYVQGGPGTAADSARALGFDVYATTEMATLIDDLRAFNADRAPSDRIQFAGFDLQRYDHNKERLLEYLRSVDPTVARSAETDLASLTDATRSTLEGPPLIEAQAAARQLLDAMAESEQRYVAASSRLAYVNAVHHLTSIERTTQLRQSVGPKYGELRDAWLAENVTWLVDREKDEGRDKVVITGHVGHVEKSSAAYGYVAMGERLATAYGDDYFVIGTEFGSNRFAAKKPDGERTEFSVDHDSELAGLFGTEPLGYVDLATASQSPVNAALLTSPVRMGMIGDEFRWYSRFLTQSYTVKVVPADAYDALVYVPNATSTTPL